MLPVSHHVHVGRVGGRQSSWTWPSRISIEEVKHNAADRNPAGLSADASGVRWPVVGCSQVWLDLEVPSV